MLDSLRGIAATQAGVFHRTQAVGAGCSRDRLRTLAANGTIERCGRGVYRFTDTPALPLQDCWIAVLVVGQPCAVSGTTVAEMLGWPYVPPAPKPQLVVPASRELVRTGVAELRSIEKWSQLTVVESAEFPGLPLLSPLDALIMLAPQVDDGLLLSVLQNLIFEGVVDVSQVMERRRTGLPGSARVGRVGEMWSLGFDSLREQRVYNTFDRAGCAPEHAKVYVVDARGRRAGPFDGYGDGAAYEVDSEVGYGTEAQQLRDVSKDGPRRGDGHRARAIPARRTA